MTDPLEVLQSQLPPNTTASTKQGVLTIMTPRIKAPLYTIKVKNKRAWADADPEMIRVIVKAVKRKLEEVDLPPRSPSLKPKPKKPAS